MVQWVCPGFESVGLTVRSLGFLLIHCLFPRLLIRNGLISRARGAPRGSGSLLQKDTGAASCTVASASAQGQAALGHGDGGQTEGPSGRGPRRALSG